VVSPKTLSERGQLSRCSDQATIWPMGYGSISADCTVSRPILGPNQPTHWAQAAVFSEIKQQKCEADPSPPCTAEANNTWSYTSTSHKAI
jgi:hypothetical protein